MGEQALKPCDICKKKGWECWAYSHGALLTLQKSKAKTGSGCARCRFYSNRCESTNTMSMEEALAKIKELQDENNCLKDIIEEAGLLDDLEDKEDDE